MKNATKDGIMLTGWQAVKGERENEREREREGGERERERERERCHLTSSSCFIVGHERGCH